MQNPRLRDPGPLEQKKERNKREEKQRKGVTTKISFLFLCLRFPSLHWKLSPLRTHATSPLPASLTNNPGQKRELLAVASADLFTRRCWAPSDLSRVSTAVGALQTASRGVSTVAILGACLPVKTAYGGRAARIGATDRPTAQSGSWAGSSTPTECAYSQSTL